MHSRTDRAPSNGYAGLAALAEVWPAPRKAFTTFKTTAPAGHAPRPELATVPSVATDAGRRASARPARRADDPTVDTYLHSLRRYPLLSREEEHDTAALFVKAGERHLADRLITANLRLVVKIALEYRGNRHNLADLVQEGNVGLILAVEKFDPDRGVKLCTYASWWIRAYILKFILSSSRLVKIGTTQAQRRLFFGLGKTRARLEKMGNTEVGPQELAAALRVSEDAIVQMEGRLAAADISLDAPIRSDEHAGRTWSDLLKDEAHLRPDRQSESKELSATVRRCLVAFEKTLAPRDLEIFLGRLTSADTVTLSALALRFGVSRERVRQLETHLKKRLRACLQASLGDVDPSTFDA
jgi:RNA polymerase sigma-32 factor